MRYFLPFLLFPVPAFAFDRPIPQPQTETAEFWFLVASVALIAALAAVHWLVARR
ncbi:MULTISPECIES: hypothetical protein [Mameliella]|uniref:Uncharacterized protein n=1 Tax=Mameliella alba TaxID=561184 RepID=A0A0B3RI37_9RHOB|nr:MULTISPECIES: hypothetical protein [Mameliella]MBV6638002.1 hypothetical protein [Mameliella sp.]MCR9273562.1 hypothetical protein [Paracoccaceae bacterium]KHQ50920.1 hypothetical protein OA50_04632 [Mameliella alba]MBY6122023.1 hypothetical protein [Mameliella alba]MDD9733207.1 hypothetical protein [Mameliella sp. AT18]